MNFTEARKLFLGAEDKTFLDSACVGLAPTTAKDAIAKFLELVVHCPARDVSDHHISMDTMKSAAITEAAKLFNTDQENLCLIESTSHGLNIAANSIDFSPSDEVLICDTEYLQVAIPFAKKHEARKLTLVPVTTKNGSLSLADFEEKVTKNTKAIVISSVQWCTGQRIFTQTFGDFCRSKNIWLIVDGVQELGALNSDASLRYADFYISGGHKWLNAPYGCGVMYLSKRAQQLEPPGYGYLNLPAPSQGWGKFFQDPAQSPFREYQFPKSAASFGIGGTGNYPGAIGLAESIKIVNQIGRENVEERIIGLTEFLREQLTKIGVKIVSPGDQKSLSGITIFRIFENQKHDVNALEHFLNQRIFLSIRYTNNYGGLRVSTHYYNTEEEIMRLCHAIDVIKSK